MTAPQIIATHSAYAKKKSRPEIVATRDDFIGWALPNEHTYMHLYAECMHASNYDRVRVRLRNQQ